MASITRNFGPRAEFPIWSMAFQSNAEPVLIAVMRWTAPHDRSECCSEDGTDVRGESG